MPKVASSKKVGRQSTALPENFPIGNPDNPNDDDLIEEMLPDDKDDRDERDDKDNKDASQSTKSITQPIIGTPIRKREVDKHAEAIKAARALPKAPGHNLDFDSMVKWLGLLTKEMWSHVVIYVYRHIPVIDKKKLDPKAVKYIDVIGEALPDYYEYMKEKHGGGEYGFMVTDTESDKMYSKVFDAKLKIPMTQYEPKIDLRELVIENRDNIPYVHRLRAEGRIDEKGNPMIPNNSQGQGQGQPNSSDILGIFKELTGFVTRMVAEQQGRSKPNSDDETLGKSIGNLLLERMKQDNPNQMVTTMTTLLQAMKADNSGGKGSADLIEMFKLLQTQNDKALQMQAENNKTIIEMMKLQLQSKQEEGKVEGESELEKITKLLDIAERLKGGRGGSRSALEVGLDIAKEIAVPVFTTINNILSLRSRAMSVSGQTTQPMQPIAQGMSGQPNPNQVPQIHMLPTQVEPAQQPPQPIIIPPNIDPQLYAAITNYGGLIIENIKIGKKGFEFAQDLINLMGPVPHAMIKKFGEDRVLEATKSVPEFWDQLEPVFGEPYLKQWLHEFLAYEEFIEGDEDKEGEGSVQ